MGSWGGWEGEGGSWKMETTVIEQQQKKKAKRKRGQVDQQVTQSLNHQVGKGCDRNVIRN